MVIRMNGARAAEITAPQFGLVQVESGRQLKNLEKIQPVRRVQRVTTSAEQRTVHGAVARRAFGRHARVPSRSAAVNAWSFAICSLQTISRRA